VKRPRRASRTVGAAIELRDSPPNVDCPTLSDGKPEDESGVPRTRLPVLHAVTRGETLTACGHETDQLLRVGVRWSMWSEDDWAARCPSCVDLEPCAPSPERQPGQLHTLPGREVIWWALGPASGETGRTARRRLVRKAVLIFGISTICLFIAVIAAVLGPSWLQPLAVGLAVLSGFPVVSLASLTVTVIPLLFLYGSREVTLGPEGVTTRNARRGKVTATHHPWGEVGGFRASGAAAGGNWTVVVYGVGETGRAWRRSLSVLCPSKPVASEQAALFETTFLRQPQAG
jgi:hypothetical protein